MDDYTVKRLALVLSVQADIEAMKAENDRRKSEGMAQAYDEQMFYRKAEELRVLAYKHNEQL